MTGPAGAEAALRTLLDELIDAATGLRLPPDANFFEAGITSAALLQVHADLVRRLGREVPLTDLFRYPNRRALARSIARPPTSGDEGWSAPARPAPVAAPTAPHSRRDLRARIRSRNGGQL